MISEADKSRARGHMGYLQVQQASTFVLGVPAGVQTQFVIEGAFSKVLPSGEARFRRLLDLMDSVENQIEENTENVAVDRVDEIELRADELTQLIKRYKYWQGSLSNLLGVPPNPFDARPMLGMGYNGGGSGINANVIG